MPELIPILSYWKKEQQVFSRHLASLKEKLSKESVHELRVAVKKLRACLDLYLQWQAEAGTSAGTEENHLFTTIELFDISGRQRDVEICLDLLKEFREKTGVACIQFENHLKAVLKTAKGWTNQQIHKYKARELARVALLIKQDITLPGEGKTDDKIIPVIDRSLSSLPGTGKPHKMRKILKTVYYQADILLNKERYQPDVLHDILDDLGSWQDHEVLLVRAHHFRKDYLPESFDEYEAIKKTEALIAENKMKLIKTVRSKTNKWLRAIKADFVHV